VEVEFDKENVLLKLKWKHPSGVHYILPEALVPIDQCGEEKKILLEGKSFEDPFS